MRCDRTTPNTWETFFSVLQTVASNANTCDISTEAELQRFKLRVAELKIREEPIKIYCGCSPVPREGFINFDVVMMNPLFLLQ